jgi:hypothetical protein
MSAGFWSHRVCQPNRLFPNALRNEAFDLFVIPERPSGLLGVRSFPFLEMSRTTSRLLGRVHQRALAVLDQVLAHEKVVVPGLHAGERVVDAELVVGDANDHHPMAAQLAGPGAGMAKASVSGV